MKYEGGYMIQTQVHLTEEQLSALEELAKRRNSSVSDLICEGVNTLLQSVSIPSKVDRQQRALAAAGLFRSGRGDLSKRHDEYLAETFDT
jgi:Arc/MetJ-type ribon-helix-helix transcriptional regulator